MFLQVFTIHCLLSRSSEMISFCCFTWVFSAQCNLKHSGSRRHLSFPPRAWCRGKTVSTWKRSRWCAAQLGEADGTTHRAAKQCPAVEEGGRKKKKKVIYPPKKSTHWKKNQYQFKCTIYLEHVHHFTLLSDRPLQQGIHKYNIHLCFSSKPADSLKKTAVLPLQNQVVAGITFNR